MVSVNGLLSLSHVSFMSASMAWGSAKKNATLNPGLRIVGQATVELDQTFLE